MSRAKYWYRKSHRTPRDLSGVPGFLEEDTHTVAFNRPLDHIEKNDLGLSIIVFYVPTDEEEA